MSDIIDRDLVEDEGQEIGQALIPALHPASLDSPADLAAAIEAILFVTGEAVSRLSLCEALSISREGLEEALTVLRSGYSIGRGIRLVEFGGNLQLGTRVEYAVYIERLLQPLQRMSLSQAATETLAVVAYRQPVTRLEVEAVRGVKCDYTISALLKKRLIKDIGRKETVGRPMLYATTDEFLRHFGIKDISELPSLGD